MRAKVKSVRRGKPLPRGRHGLSAGEVQASQRARLLQAMLQLTRKQGYAATTIPQIVAAARVSSNTFYEHFEDKEDCFLTACDDIRGARGVAAQSFEGVDWVDAVRYIVRGTLQWCDERPELAHAVYVEMLLVSQKAVRQREKAYRSFEPLCVELAAQARLQNPKLPPLRPSAPQMLVVAMTEFIAAEIRDGRDGNLIRLEDDFVYLTVKLLADEEMARAAAAGKDA